MREKYWTDEEHPDRLARSLFWRVVAVTAAFLIVGGLLTAVVWAVKVATSGPRGAGDQARIVNDARNRINAQQWFHDQYAQVAAADTKLDLAYVNVQAGIGTPDEMFVRMTYTGLLSRCVEMREQYNAEARKVTREQWRDPQLPVRLPDTDEHTDCLPTQAGAVTASPTGSPR